MRSCLELFKQVEGVEGQFWCGRTRVAYYFIVTNSSAQNRPSECLEFCRLFKPLFDINVFYVSALCGNEPQVGAIGEKGR